VPGFALLKAEVASVIMGSLIAAIGCVVGVILLFYVYDRWIQPRVTQRWINKTLKKIQSGKLTPAPKQSNWTISLDAAGFTISQVKRASVPALSIAWADVLRVTAFKCDLFTVDCICMAITAKDETVLEVNEDMVGWEAFTEALPNFLPGSIPWTHCFYQVAFPAFATNETAVFTRESPPRGGEVSDGRPPLSTR
jgi:hypothetical protein